MQALLGLSSEARWLRFAAAHRQHLFPYLPQQPGYNKRLRNLAATINWLIGMLARDTPLWTDDVWIIDSTDPTLSAPRPGQILIGDKNYFGAEFEATLTEEGLTLLRPARKGEPDRAGNRFFKPCAEPSNRSSTPTKTNSTSKTTAARAPPASWSASCNAYSL